MLKDKTAEAPPTDKEIRKWVQETAESQRREAEAAESQAEAEEKKAEAEKQEADAEEKKAEAEKDDAKSAKEKAAGENELNDSENSNSRTADSAIEAAKEEAETQKKQAEAAEKEVRLEQRDINAKERMYSSMAEQAGEESYAGFGFFVLINALLAMFIIHQYGMQAVAGAYSFGLFILAAVVYKFALKQVPGGLRFIVIILLILIVFFGGYTLWNKSLPYFVEYVQSGRVIEAGEDVAAAGERAGRSFWKDLQESWDEQIAIAKGEKLQGNVDQNVKENVGIELLPPLVENIKKINRNELAVFDGELVDGIGARIKGFDPKTPITVRAVCSLQNRTESKSKIGFDMHAGTQQPIHPEKFSGTFFTTPVICRPVIPPDPEIEGLPACGRYTVTITAQANGLRTDAFMDNYLIDNEILKDSLNAYAQSKGELKLEQVPSAIAEIFPTIGDYRSVSDKGAIKVIMVTQKTPLIGIDQSTQLTLRVALENAMKGWIVNVTNVEITIPEFLTVMNSDGKDFCPGWNKEGNKIILSKQYKDAMSTSIMKLSKGKQKVLPACYLVPLVTSMTLKNL